MNRTPRLLATAALALVLAATAASAQVRSIPAEAKRGVMRNLQDLAVEINGRPTLIAPGAQIRDATNLIVVPAMVPSGSLVKFTLDPQGQLTGVWILTAEEAAQPEPRR